MTRIPAKVLSSQFRGDQYCITVLIEVANFRRSFNSLRFGEIIPFSGSYQDGTLELRYYQDPALAVGQPFPLWSIEYRAKEKRKIRRRSSAIRFFGLSVKRWPLGEDGAR
jgi:hypothetical protein